MSRLPEPEKYARAFPVAPRSQARDGTIPDDKFFLYWKELPEWTKPRQLTYIQRVWPVLNYSLLLTPEQASEFDKQYPAAIRQPKDIDKFLRKQGIFKYIEKFTEPWPTKDWRAHILRHWGSGDYLLFLNDLGVDGHPALKGTKTLCTTITHLRDENYPPVLDIKILDMYDPANVSYIQERRLRGLPLPDDEDRALDRQLAEEDDMNQTVSQVLDSNDKLTKQVIELAKEKAVPAPAAPTAAAEGKALDLLSEAHKRALEAQSPQQYVDNLVKVVGLLNVGRGDDSTVKTLLEQQKLTLETQEKHHKAELEMIRENNKTVLEMQEKAHQAELRAVTSRMDALEQRLANPAATTALSAPGAFPQSFGDQFRQFMDMSLEFDKFKKRLGGAPEEPEEPHAEGWAGVVERVIDRVVDVVGQPDFMEKLVLLRGAAQPAAQPSPQAAAPTAQQVEENKKAMRDKQIADQLLPHLKAALAQKFTGFQFAGNIIASYGIALYDEYTAQGESGLTSFMMRTGIHPVLVQQFGAEAVGQFITEYLDRDKAVMVAQELARMKQGQAPADAASPPANGAPGPRINRAQ